MLPVYVQVPLVYTSQVFSRSELVQVLSEFGRCAPPVTSTEPFFSTVAVCA